MISIIVPVYNVEQYLSRCVDSILKQTVTDFELILVDDGSPDQCGAICDDYALKDSRVKVIHKENGGLSDARNAGLRAAVGEYIAFVDSDDWVMPRYLEKLLSGIENADICACEIVRTAGEDFQENSDIQSKEVFNTESALKNLIDDHIFHQYVWNKLYRRQVIANIFFETGKTNEDEFWTYQVFGNADRIVKISDVLYCYYQRPGSIMNNSYSKKRLDGLAAKAQRQSYLEEHYPALVPAGKRNLFYTYTYAGQMICRYMQGEEFEEAKAIVDEYRNKYRMTADDMRGYSIYEKTWFHIMNMNFWRGCRLRNLLKIGF